MKKILMFCAVALAATMPVYAEFKDAVEMTGGEFVCSGDADWIECYDDAYEGDSCLRSGYVYYNKTSNLKLTVTMAEAGSISFWWKRKGSGWVSFTIDDRSYSLEAEDVTVWNKFTTELKAGTHVFQWNYQSPYTSNSNAIFIDKISIPGYEVIDPDSQDPDNTLWTTTDRNLYRSGVIGHGRYSYKTMTVKGKGVLSFKWRTSSEQHFDRLAVTFDGNSIVPAISGETEWTKVVYTNEAAGVHSVRWRYSKDSDTTAGDDCGYVKDVRWGDGTIPFKYDKTDDMYKSGKIDNNDQSEAELLISASSYISFDWKVSSQADHDFLSCYVDGVLKSSISGETDWDWISCGGTGWGDSAHTIKFVYSKDASGSVGADCGYFKSYNLQERLLAWRVRGLTPTVGSGAWTCESSGEESYYLSAPASGNSSILPVTVSSNGKITFLYRAYESGTWSSLDLYVDGKRVKSFSAYDEYWNSASYTIRDPGTHLIEWRASSGRVCIKLNNDYYSKWYTGTRQPWVIDMQDYVKAPKDDVGDKGWVESAVEYYSGFRSGKISSNQTSRVTARVGSSGENLSFRWKTTGEHVGKLNFYVNGELKASLTGATEEQYFSEYLSLYEREENEFVWEYVNGEGAKSGEDFGWIYDVQWGYGMGGSLEWGTLGSDEEEDPGWKEPVYHWSTVTNFDNTVTLTGVTPDPSGCLRFPAKVDGRQVVSIGDQFDRSFSWGVAERITEVVISQGITNIGYSAFANSKNLANVTFPSGLHTIGKWAFNGASIRHIKVPEGVATIGAGAFGSSPAEIVLLPSTLTDLATSWSSPGKVYEDELTVNPFFGCAANCVFSFPQGNANYSVINGHIVSADGVLISGLSSGGTAMIPSCVRAIGSYAFSECDTLRNIYIPGTVKSICSRAFEGSGLVSAHLDSGVEFLRSYGFRECSCLASVVLSEGLQSIDASAFSGTPVRTLEIPSTVTSFYNAACGMTNLTSITFKGNAPKPLGDSIFFWYDVPAAAVVYIPRGSQGWRSESDVYSEELPSSGYWPWNSSSYGRKIYWYGNEPSDWTDPWWNKMDVSFSDKGWTGLRGVYTSPGWKDATYSSSVHTNSATITVNGPGIIALDVMATGNQEGTYVRIFIDGVEMDYAWSRSASSSYSSARWSRFEYGIAEEGAHTVVIEYRVPNNYYGGSEKAYLNLQNVVWTPKSSWVKPDYVWETSDNGDGTVTILSVSPAPAFDLVVPAFVNGKRVTGIGARYSGSGTKYFSESPNLVTSVTLPEGLLQINRYAFGGSRRLKSIDFPSTLTGLESCSFSGCYSLTEAILPEGVTQFESSLFSSCRFLRRVRVPATVKSIGAYVFDYDTALEEIMFAGDCPSVYSDMLKYVPNTCQIKVFRGTTGWGEIEIPGIWMGHPISYVETPPHTVFFDANGGTCPVASKTVYEQSVYSELPVPTIDDPHFCFDGWYTQREGGKKVVSSSVVGEKADHTLYAHWVTAYYEVRITTLHGKASGGFFEYGTTNVFRSPGIVTEGKTRYICLGSSSYPEQGNEVTIVMGTNTVTFAWDLWRTEHAVTVDPGANGSITGAVSGWFAEGTVLDLRAVANEGYCVDHWTGDLAEATVLSPDRISDIVRRGHTIGASFRTGSSSPKPDGGPYTEKVGDLVWTYIVSNGVAIVGGGSEAQPAIPKSTTGDLVIPTVLGDRPVRGIAAYAFNECRISSVRIPNAVTHIDRGAFQWCTALSSVAYPSSLEDIGVAAFYCSSLSSVSLAMPNLRRIGKSAYTYGSSLRSVSIVGTNLVIEAEAFYKQPTTSVSISGRNIEIGDGAFDHYNLSAGSSDYASVSLTGSGIVLGKRAFADMRHGGGVSLNLTGVRSIGESAFAYMGHNAIYRQSSSGFWYTRGVTDISISSELKSAPAKAFEGGSIGKLCVDDVDTIFGIEGFWNCVAGAFHMSNQGFWYDLWVGDERILTLRIPEGVTAIPEKALCGIVLKSIEVPDSVVSLGSMAFGNCRATVQFEGLPPTCGEKAMVGCSSVAYTDHESDWARVIEDGKWMELPAFHGQALDYASALGVRGVTMSTGAPQSWFIQSTMTHDKTTAIQSACMAGNGTSTLVMEIDGPVEMSYWWKSVKGTSGCGNSTQFSLDGTTMASISGNADWAQIESAIPEGHHKLVWEYWRGNSDHGSGEDCCAIADMTLLHTVTFDVGDHGYCAGGGALVQKVSRGEAAEAPLIIPHRGYQFVGWDGDFDAILENKTITAVYRQISIDEAINTPEALERGSGLHFTTGGNDSWYVVPDDFDPENYVARSGNIGNDQNSFVKTTVSGSGRLTFKWRADTEAIEFRGKIYGLDIATFTVDGEKPIEIFGKTADYVDVSVDIEGEGTHTLCWIYVKDGEDDGVEREDCVWLDEVAWTPDVQPIEPGGEIVVPEGKAEEKAAEINSDPAVKAQYLKAPGGIETTAEYRECFNAVATSGSTVEFVLSEKGTNEVVKATTTVKTAALDVVFSEGATLTIDEPLLGFYYSLRQGGDLSVGAKADLNKLGGRDEISFELTKGPFQYFYQTLVTPTPQK